MKDIIVLILMVVAIICLVGANIAAIGTFLYDWGKLDMAIGTSAWNAFVLWIKMLAIGVLSLIVSKVME